MRHTDEYTRIRLLSRSRVDEGSPIINGARCRCWMRSTRGGYGRLWDGERLEDAHRASFRVFVGPIPAGTEVTHACDRPGCIEPAHLEAKTHAANIRDIDSRGRRPPPARGMLGREGVRGSRHPSAKLTDEQALDLRDNREATRAELAAKYDVSLGLIDGIRRGDNWAWLPPRRPHR